MLYMRAFINFFFVPVVAYFLLSRQIGKELKPDFETFLMYMILVCFNIPFTRVITFILRITVGIEIEADSSYYTVAALISAVLLPYLYEFGKSFWKNEKERNNKETIKKSLDDTCIDDHI